jgi:hypothetical protein
MKFQSLHDLMDPDVPAPEPEPAPSLALELEPEVAGTEEPELPEDAYVIGEAGDSVLPSRVQVTTEDDARRQAWIKPAAFALFGLFVALTAWNLSGLFQGPPPPPAPSPFQLKQALYMGVMKVNGYRRAHGVTPESLGALDLPDTAYAYRRVSDDHFVISIRANGERLEYDSDMSKDEFFGKPDAILSMGEPTAHPTGEQP